MCVVGVQGKYLFIHMLRVALARGATLAGIMWRPSVFPVEGKALVTGTLGAADVTAPELKVLAGASFCCVKTELKFLNLSEFSFPLIAEHLVLVMFLLWLLFHVHLIPSNWWV